MLGLTSTQTLQAATQTKKITHQCGGKWRLGNVTNYFKSLLGYLTYSWIQEHSFIKRVLLQILEMHKVTESSLLESEILPPCHGKRGKLSANWHLDGCLCSSNPDWHSKTWNYLAKLGNVSAAETHPSQLEAHTFWSSPAALIEISSWETLKSFFWDGWCPQCISTPLPPSLRHKVLLPAGTDAPRAPFSQSCLWSRWELCGDWCEWGAGGDERGHLKFMLLDGMGL